LWYILYQKNKADQYRERYIVISSGSLALEKTVLAVRPIQPLDEERMIQEILAAMNQYYSGN
jgi:hypothetical protein